MIWKEWLSDDQFLVALAAVFAGASLLLIVLVTFLLMRLRRKLQDDQSAELAWKLLDQQSRFEQVLRQQISQDQMQLRQELLSTHETFRESVSRDARSLRTEINESLERFASVFTRRLEGLVKLNEDRMQDLRNVVDTRLQSLQQDNAQRLEQMRKTVDEKLHETLEQRLGESFRQVSERLEAVHKGLGEMQALASGVGDLKRVLTNVKTRGTWGEVQLMRLVEDIMTPEQYAINVKPVPGSDAIVELAIRLPGKNPDEQPVWMPIDAKFPKEEYERLLQAQDDADKDAVRVAANGLGKAVEAQAKLIAEKYLSPPWTTDFAVMFLPSEGLYAEVLKQPGLLDRLQGLRVIVAGPANLAALLNSLQMGFRTLAIEQRSSEVWKLLRSVKTEFGKFGEALASARKSLETASRKIGSTETRTRVMLRTLKDVEALEGQDTDVAEVFSEDAEPLTSSLEEDEEAKRPRRGDE